MNPREIVRRTLDFENPDRVARSFGESDFVSAGCSARGHATDWREVGGGRWERTDEWGNTWGRLESHSKGEVTRGVLADWSDLDRYVFPDFGRPEDYADVRKVRQEYPDRWLIGGLPGFTFNVARYMRRMEEYLADLILERDRIRALHDRVDTVLEAMIRQHAEAGADAVMFPEDWGTQTQTLVSPELWREEFYPRFEKLCGVAHERGLRVFMHSCGQIEAIVPDLIRAGIDLLQFDQPELHGLDTLAAHQDRARITFWCPVDIQKILQTRDEKLIRARARAMLEKLWRGRGGFVAGRYMDEPSIGLEPRWQDAACDEFLRHGVNSPA